MPAWSSIVSSSCRLCAMWHRVRQNLLKLCYAWLLSAQVTSMHIFLGRPHRLLPDLSSLVQVHPAVS